MTPTHPAPQPLAPPDRGSPSAVADTLSDAILREMTRVRDEVLPAYLAVGPAGGFAVAMMRRELDAAARALAQSDVAACLRLHESLKEYHT